MSHKYVGYKIPIIVIFIFMVGTFALLTSTRSETADSIVIATVNSEPITYSMIKTSLPGLQGHSIEKLGWTEDQKLDYERSNLAKQIRLSIRKQEVKRLGITVSDDEIKKKWNQLLQEKDSPETINRIKTKVIALANGLERVYEESHDPDVVYQSDLSEIVTKKEWKVALRQFKSPKLREYLNTYYDNKDTSIDEYKEMIHGIVQTEKLNKAIDEILEKTDQEYSDYKRSIIENRTNTVANAKGPNYEIAKRYEWWLQRYREAKIEIKNQQYNSVSELLEK